MALKDWQFTMLHEIEAKLDRVLASVEAAPSPAPKPKPPRAAQAAPCPPPDDQLRLLSVSETHARLGVGKRKFYGMMAAGEIAWVQVGAHRKFEPRELDKWIAEHRQTEAAQRSVVDPEEGGGR